MAKKYRLSLYALKLSPKHFTIFKENRGDKGVTVCLGCTKPETFTIPSAQTGGPPVDLTVQPATQAQMKALYEAGNPLIEAYDENEPSPTVAPVRPAPAPEKG